jgi:hypothetical protein
MFARGALTTGSVALIALAVAACSSTPEPVAPNVPGNVEPAIAMIEVPRVATAARPREAEASAPAASTPPRQAEPRAAQVDEPQPAAPKILLPCSPSDPGCGVLGVLGGTSTLLGASGGGGTGVGGGGLGGALGLGSLGSGASGNPTIRVPAKPTGNADIVSQSVSNPISNAATVVAGMRAGFRRCYNRALAQDPSLQGLVSLRLEVAADGSVTKASATSNKPLDVARACIEARGASSQFAPPDNGKAASVVIAVKLTPPPPPSTP